MRLTQKENSPPLTLPQGLAPKASAVGNQRWRVQKKPVSQEESPESAEPQPVQTSPTGFEKRFSRFVPAVNCDVLDR